MKSTDISLIVITLIFCLGSNVLFHFGINENLFQTAMVALAVIPSCSLFNSWKKNDALAWLMLFLCIFSVIKLLTDRGEGTRTFLLTIISAPIIYSSLPVFYRRNAVVNQTFWSRLLTVMLVAYLAETLIAIFERVTGSQVFGWSAYIVTLDAIGIDNYRSTAMYGHPLYNALMVSIAMAFILASSLRPKYKFSLWGIGYAAILCFNARASIVGNALLLGVYVLYTSFVNYRMKSSTRVWVLFAGVSIALIAYAAVMTGLVGGRLVNMGLMDDDSSQVRLNAMDFIMDMDYKTYLLGMSYNEYTNLLFYNHIEALENFWLEYILRYGLIFLLCYVFFYFFFIKHELKNYTLFSSFFVSAAFVLIASTNNSLSTSFVALLYYLVLIRLFDPVMFKRIVKHRYTL